MITLDQKTRAWVANASDIEKAALDQLRNVAMLPVIDAVCAMPDVHMGVGAAVGSVIASRVAVIPSAVGVDIGCGMLAARLNLNATDLPDSLAPLRLAIEERVPVGFAQHNDLAVTQPQLVAAFRELHDAAKRLAAPIIDEQRNRITRQLGTLGGGNHFIELCLDEHDGVWLMLHSGSRHIGKAIADIHINVAKNLARQRQLDLPDASLAWLEDGTPEFRAYYDDVTWAQNYARLNREAMLAAILDATKAHIPNAHIVGSIVSCHHNYIDREGDHYITRKGAVAAHKGQLGIIPGSMGTRSYIVEGLGNPDAFCSCSHGAGRRLSRGAAKRAYTVKDLAEQTIGVECRKDDGVLDEIPAAYKNIDTVMHNQQDLVRPLATLKALLCVKG